MRRLLMLLAVLLLAEPAAAQETTVVLVRHAEKVDESADAALSAAGLARAAALGAALEHAGVRAIFVTQFQRTRGTAEPLATRLGLAPTVVATGGTAAEHAQRVADAVREARVDGTVLVVGHSNTVPLIIRALGGPDVGAIADDEYANLFVVRLSPGGVSLIRSRY